MGMSILTIFEFIFFAYDYMVKGHNQSKPPESSTDANKNTYSLDTPNAMEGTYSV